MTLVASTQPEQDDFTQGYHLLQHGDRHSSLNAAVDSSNNVLSRNRTWENVNWSTTYSSDEESQGSSPSRCLFPDHLLTDEEDAGSPAAMVVDEEDMTPPQSPAAHRREEREIVFLMDPSPLVDPLVLMPSAESAAPLYNASITTLTSGAATPPPPPQRTRRRTQSQNHAVIEVGSTGDSLRAGGSLVDAVDGSSHLQHQQHPRHLVRNQHLYLTKDVRIPAARSLWVTAALVTTLLMFGGIHPGEKAERDLHRVRTNMQPLERPDRVSSLVTPTELSDVLPPPSHLAGEGRQPSRSTSSTSTRFMHAVGTRDAPLAFRAPPALAGRRRASDSYLFHGLYVSLLVGIVLWSAREVRREVRERRRQRPIRQESICDLL